MNSPDEAPKLTPWPFLAADVILLGAAYLIGSQHSSPLNGTPLIVVGSLVFAGALVAVLPFLINHTRRQELALAERQQEIAALAQTTSASAEQLSIAVASLHGISESASKAAKLAEQLPVKMQEKVHEFKERLNEVALTENEALSQEVNTLRSAETERIETVLTTVRKLSSEFARLEAASRKNVTELSEMLTKFTASAQQAAAEATSAVAEIRTGAEKSLAEAQMSSLRSIEGTLSRALAEIDGKLVALSGELTAKIQRASELLDVRIATLQASALRATGDTGHQTMRTDPVVPVPTQPAPVTTTPSAEDVVLPAKNNPEADPVEATRAPSSTEAPADEPKPARRRAHRRAEQDSEPLLGLDLPPPSTEDFSQISADESAVSSVSTDGFTRLLVTSYIGIGNKLFLRGEGPGLSWERGTPLQFVSIGKWRWETSDATAPIRAKLFKNDEIECPSLGEIVIDPAHQKEVRANFH
ncbi:hypothetical protein DB347_02565 [Opitutaceae bacterium EW11]|nr:hypothetical protein DB347_02565 [Opitutaceae bacterium EW11]